MAMEADTLLEEKLTSLVTKIMLSDKVTGLFATIVRDEVDALKTQLGASLRDEIRAEIAATATGPGAVSRRLANGDNAGSPVCTLSGCGDDAPCADWNKILEDVDACHECATKRFQANGLLGCTCSYSCAVPPPEAAPDADASPATTVEAAAIASDNLAGSSLWLGDDNGALAIGANADVRLFKNDAGAHGLRTNANLTVDGVLQVGQGDAMACDSKAASGTLRWYAEKKSLQVCEGDSGKWKAAGGAVLDAADGEPCTSENAGALQYNAETWPVAFRTPGCKRCVAQLKLWPS